MSQRDSLASAFDVPQLISLLSSSIVKTHVPASAECKALKRLAYTTLLGLDEV